MPPRRVLLALGAAGLAACFAPRRGPRGPYVPDPGPVVDTTCLAAGREGKLLADVPEAIGDYRVTRRSDRQLYLRRSGRPLTDEESAALWRRPIPQAVALGHSGLSSSFASCPDVPGHACLMFDLWLCRTTLARLIGELDASLASIDASDAELGVDVTVIEASGPRCKQGAACVPTRHYSHAGTFHPEGARLPLSGHAGVGRCEGDGDCDGQGNVCHAWYLGGGAETLEYVSMSRPTFCGCVDGLCAWFTQR